MKSRSEIWASVAVDLAAQCSANTTRDLETVTRRVAAEGDTFFKVTLPTFAKALERSLEESFIETDNFVGFSRRLRKIGVKTDGAGTKWKKYRHGNPEFLGGFMAIIFDDSYEVSSDEYYTLENVASCHDLPGYSYFPPLLRIPANPAEERRIAIAIMSVRQLCLMFGKEKELCSDSLIDRAISEYKSTDESLIDPF